MSFLPTLFKKLQRDNALFLARGLAFDVVVCLIPATFLLFVLFGFLFESPRETIRYMTPYLKAMIPFPSQQVLLNLFGVVKEKQVLGVLGIAGLIWTLSRVFGSIRTVLDVVFSAKEGRGILRGKLFDLKVMLLSSLCFLATVLVTSLFALLRRAGVNILGMKFLYLGARGELISLLLAFFFTFCLFFYLYKIVPKRRILTRTAFYAALAASVLWEMAKHGFRHYLFTVADLGQVYGSFGLLFALVFWIYYSCIVFIFGAELGWILEKKGRE